MAIFLFGQFLNKQQTNIETSLHWSLQPQVQWNNCWILQQTENELQSVLDKLTAPSIRYIIRLASSFSQRKKGKKGHQWQWLCCKTEDAFLYIACSYTGQWRLAWNLIYYLLKIVNIWKVHILVTGSMSEGILSLDVFPLYCAQAWLSPCPRWPVLTCWARVHLLYLLYLIQMHEMGWGTV